MEEKSKKEDNGFECKVCKMTFTTKKDYERHMREHHKND